MIIRSKNEPAKSIMIIVIVLVAYVFMIYEFGRESFEFFTIVYSIILFFSIRNLVALGRNLVMDEDGCTVSFGKIKKYYRWDELKLKRVERYEFIFSSDFYKGAVVFSLKNNCKPKNMKPAIYSILIHPFSFFFVYFDTGRVKYKHERYPIWYEVDEKEFLKKMKEWNVDLQGL